MIADSSQRSSYTLAIAAAAAIAIVTAVAVAIAALVAPAKSAGRTFPPLIPAAAPPGWSRVTLPNGNAQLSYPPALHSVIADADAVSAARLSSRGVYLAYLNATPRQSSEALGTWPAFRLRLLRADDAASVHLIAAATGVRFRGGTGSCVVDAYLSRIGHHSYREIACLVRGRTSASVIVAAAPAASWNQERPQLLRAVAAYKVR